MSPSPTFVLIVAAGRGTRAGGGLPKQYRHIRGMPMLRRTLLPFLAHPRVNAVRVVIHPEDEALYREAVEGLNLLSPVHGGATRQASVRNGLLAHEAADGIVLIHDAARPFVSPALVDRCLDALEQGVTIAGVAPALPVTDSLRRGGGTLHEPVSREGLLRVQTPQCFRYKDLLDAFASASEDQTDDAAVAMAAGLEVGTVPGEEANFKVTSEEDFSRAEEQLGHGLVSRTGFGFDVHAFAPGEELWLGGLLIPHDRGLSGHSDADVLLHAITDALLGAIAEGDIGTHFPPSDPQWRAAPSSRFIEHARRLVQDPGGIIDHVDATIICEAPRIGPHREALRQSVAGLLRLPAGRVSIKATTTERLGFTGRGEGMAAQAVVSVRVPEVP